MSLLQTKINGRQAFLETCGLLLSLICVRCVFSVGWCCLQVCMICEQLYIDINAFIENPSTHIYLNFSCG